MVINSFHYCAFPHYFFNICPTLGFQINFTFFKKVSPDIFSVFHTNGVSGSSHLHTDFSDNFKGTGGCHLFMSLQTVTSKVSMMNFGNLVTVFLPATFFFLR